MTTQSVTGQTPTLRELRARTYARSIVGSLLSIKVITVILSFVLVFAFAEWRLAYASGVILATSAFSYSKFLSRYASILCRCIMPFLIGGICVETYIFVHNSPILDGYIKYLRFNEFYKEPFYTAISTLYAIITALALVKSIEDFDEIKNNVAEEAHKVRSMLDLTEYFGNGNDDNTKIWIARLHDYLRDYARNVSNLADIAIRSVNYKVLRDCQHAIAQLKPVDENDKFSLQKLMEERAGLATLRVKRINSIGEVTPSYLIVALWLVSASLILPFFAEPLMVADPTNTTQFISNPVKYTQYYMIFLMGTLYSFLLLMLSDISNPFDGFWIVDMQAFDELTETVDAELANTQPPLSVATDTTLSVHR
jgi:hypothetical protein